jgi:uncharacterized protein (DUF1810 family)
MTRSGDGDDPHGLRRFVDAQEGVYERALGEIRAGEKRTHWMWFIFPQVDGLGWSATARRYAIRGRAMAGAYLAHPVLGPRLEACAEALLGVQGRTASEVFGWPDDLKLRSSMTLFAEVAGPGSVFERVLERFCDGDRDERTLEILAREEKMGRDCGNGGP